MTRRKILEILAGEKVQVNAPENGVEIGPNDCVELTNNNYTNIDPGYKKGLLGTISRKYKAEDGNISYIIFYDELDLPDLIVSEESDIKLVLSVWANRLTDTANEDTIEQAKKTLKSQTSESILKKVKKVGKKVLKITKKIFSEF